MHDANRLAKQLNSDGLPAAAIHANNSQSAPDEPDVMVSRSHSLQPMSATSSRPCASSSRSICPEDIEGFEPKDEVGAAKPDNNRGDRGRSGGASSSAA